MAKGVNQFGLLCRKMRLEKKLTMTDFAKAETQIRAFFRENPARAFGRPRLKERKI
jgi:hypothetical protein